MHAACVCLSLFLFCCFYTLTRSSPPGQLSLPCQFLFYFIFICVVSPLLSDCEIFPVFSVNLSVSLQIKCRSIFVLNFPGMNSIFLMLFVLFCSVYLLQFFLKTTSPPLQSTFYRLLHFRFVTEEKKQRQFLHFFFLFQQMKRGSLGHTNAVSS